MSEAELLEICRLLAPHGDARARATLTLFADRDDLRRKLELVAKLAEERRLVARLEQDSAARWLAECERLKGQLARMCDLLGTAVCG